MKAATESAIHSTIAHKLNGMECEDIPLFNFLAEFAARYSVLGTEVSLLRTIDDFKNFDRKTSKESGNKSDNYWRLCCYCFEARAE